MRRSRVILMLIFVCGISTPIAVPGKDDSASEPGTLTVVEDLNHYVPESVLLVQAPYRGDTVVYTDPPPDVEIVESAAVDEMVFCAAIKDRTPVTVSDTFPSDISAVYCYTRIVGARDSTAVTHSWYHGDTKVVDVNLPVRSSLWRTWSRKTIAPGGRGEWKVDVIAPDESVIASKKFFIE
jgi:hypothetical protein